MKVRGVAWRAMTTYDLSDVEKIAAEVHPAFPESAEIIAEKQSLYRNGAYLLEIGERPAGYVLSHPWKMGSVPKLNTLIGTLPAPPDTYYLHDLALLPVVRRVGAASFIVEALAKHAGAIGFATMSLVAVNNSQSFWARHGFEVEDVPHLAVALGSYDDTARLMVRRL